jgi:eukaryotic translation initiation factor 2C
MSSRGGSGNTLGGGPPARGRGGGASRGGGNAPRGGGAPRGSGGQGGSGFRDGPRGGFQGGGGGGGRGRGGAPQIYAAGAPPRTEDAQRIAASEAAIVKYAQVPYDPRNPLRPGFGTLGVPIRLRANFFAVKIPKTPILEYKVEITPKENIQRLKTRIFQLVEESPLFVPHLGYVAHDRSERLVSAKKLPQPLDISVVFVEEGMQQPAPNAKTYTVSIVHTGELDPSGLLKYTLSYLRRKELSLII